MVVAPKQNQAKQKNQGKNQYEFKLDHCLWSKLVLAYKDQI